VSTVSRREEGEYENASYHPHVENGKEEAHVEPAILVQPLSGEEASGSESGLGVVPLCEAASDGPCARDSGGFHGDQTTWTVVLCACAG
jgi:hypothetical protein